MTEGPPTKLDYLESLYGQEMSERDRAELEAKIWSAVSPEERKLVEGAGIRKGLVGYISYRFSVGQGSLRNRQFLFGAGPIADPLWERIDGHGMPVHTARRLLNEAMEASEAGMALETALAKKIAKYEGTGYLARVGNKVVRKVPKSSKMAMPTEVEADSWEPPLGPAPEGREFWAFLRTQTLNYVMSRVPDADPGIREKMVSNFEADLRSVVQTFRVDIGRAARMKSIFQPAGPSRREVLEACRTLNIDPPKVGSPVDESVLKRQMRAYARAYHPDRAGGTEETRVLFDQSQKAYVVIRDYNLQSTHQVEE